MPDRTNSTLEDTFRREWPRLVAAAARIVGDLGRAEEIAKAFLVPEATLAQRVVRAKRVLADAQVRFAIPDRQDWGERLPAVSSTTSSVETWRATRWRGPPAPTCCGGSVATKTAQPSTVRRQRSQATAPSAGS
jgi:predicted RNA polymerase sigma factor